MNIIKPHTLNYNISFIQPDYLTLAGVKYDINNPMFTSTNIEECVVDCKRKKDCNGIIVNAGKSCYNVNALDNMRKDSNYITLIKS